MIDMSANLDQPPAGDVWLLAVNPALTGDLTAWLHARGLMLGPMPPLSTGEPVWITSPTDEHLEMLL